MMHNLAGPPFDGKYMTSYQVAIAMFALSYQIFAKQEKFQNFDHEHEGQVKE